MFLSYITLTIVQFFFFLIFWLCHTQHTECGTLIVSQGSNHVRCSGNSVLTTGPPGKSPEHNYVICFPQDYKLQENQNHGCLLLSISRYKTYKNSWNVADTHIQQIFIDMALRANKCWISNPHFQWSFDNCLIYTITHYLTNPYWWTFRFFQSVTIIHNASLSIFVCITFSISTIISLELFPRILLWHLTHISKMFSNLCCHKQ